MGKWHDMAVKTYEQIDMRKKEREYQKRLLESAATDVQIKGMERMRRKKVGQF